MTRQQRVLQAVNHQQPDICPWQVDFTAQAYEKVVQYTGDPSYINGIGNHIVGCFYGGYLQEIKPGYFKDHFGVVWNRTGADKDIGVIEGYVLPEPTLKGYQFPEFDEARWRGELESVLSVRGECAAVAGIGFSLFERAWTLRGMENLLMDMLAEPEFVHQLLDAICEHNLQYLSVIMEYPFDGIYLGDDWGQQKGTIMGPGHWREFIKPRLARMYGLARSNGKFVVQHSCGDIRELFPDLIEVGLNVYQTFQPEIYDVRQVKSDFGKDLAFWGGISTQRTLPFVTPAEVKEITKRMIADVGSGGGYIAGPTHAIPGDVPAENIVALVEALHEQSA